MHDAERHAARMTVQAGAGALISMTAGACDDIVLCWQPRQPGEHPADANSDNLMVRPTSIHTCSQTSRRRQRVAARAARRDSDSMHTQITALRQS